MYTYGIIDTFYHLDLASICARGSMICVPDDKFPKPTYNNGEIANLSLCKFWLLQLFLVLIMIS